MVIKATELPVTTLTSVKTRTYLPVTPRLHVLTLTEVTNVSAMMASLALVTSVWIKTSARTIHAHLMQIAQIPLDLSSVSALLASVETGSLATT